MRPASSVSEIKVPEEKMAIQTEAEKKIQEVNEQYQMGLITEQEYEAKKAELLKGL